MLFRQLKPNEIECKVGQVFDKKNALSLLLYKTARTDAKIMDETFGEDNWSVEHYQVKNKDFARVGVRCEDGTWVYKSDCGTESDYEAEKGESSDALKRACSVWGLGRALYSSPFIYIQLKEDEFFIDKNGKKKPDQSIKFSVTRVEYDAEGDMSGLTIIREDTGAVVFDKTWGVSANSYDAKRAYESIVSVFKDKIVIKDVMAKCGVSKFANLTEDKFDEICFKLIEAVYEKSVVRKEG